MVGADEAGEATIGEAANLRGIVVQIVGVGQKVVHLPLPVHGLRHPTVSAIRAHFFFFFFFFALFVLPRWCKLHHR
jgi:hypothetical protein